MWRHYDPFTVTTVGVHHTGIRLRSFRKQPLRTHNSHWSIRCLFVIYLCVSSVLPSCFQEILWMLAAFVVLMFGVYALFYMMTSKELRVDKDKELWYSCNQYVRDSVYTVPVVVILVLKLDIYILWEEVRIALFYRDGLARLKSKNYVIRSVLVQHPHTTNSVTLAILTIQNLYSINLHLKHLFVRYRH